ncbi:unnamed protein product, partial [marine sediment metagenome]
MTERSLACIRAIFLKEQNNLRKFSAFWVRYISGVLSLLHGSS